MTGVQTCALPICFPVTITVGTLLVDRTSNLINDSFVLGQEINFGDGLNSSNNLTIEILPAATLNVLSGCVTTNDV